MTATNPNPVFQLQFFADAEVVKASESSDTDED